jgi:hypothetical protein
MGKLKASAAFYILALAAQVSGFTSTAVAVLLAFVATTLLAWAAWDHKEDARAFASRWRLRAPWEPRDSVSQSASPHQAYLYVGEMGADLSKLQTNSVLEIWLRCFNATGRRLHVQRIRGQIAAQVFEDGSGKGQVSLPPAILLDDRAPTQQLPDGREFMLVIEQRLPKPVTEDILSVSGTKSVQFDFDSLYITVCDHDDPAFVRDLRLWDGMSFQRYDGIRTARATILRLQSGGFRSMVGGNMT